MDDVDEAQKIEEVYRSAALNRRPNAADRARLAAIICVTCGADIPVGRRYAVPGTKVCVDCQAEAESAGP